MMKYNEKMFNRQMGRNAQLFARKVGEMETPEARYPYLRMLVGVVEQARPEWVEVPEKAQLYTHLINEMAEQPIAPEEIARVVRVRDRERQTLHDLSTGKLKAPEPPAPTAPADAPEAPADAPTAAAPPEAAAEEPSEAAPETPAAEG